MVTEKNNKLKKHFNKYLPKGYRILFDSGSFKVDENFELNSYEKKIIKFWLLKQQNKKDFISCVIPISERIHLDFIGWFNPKYKDVLICKHKKTYLK